MESMKKQIALSLIGTAGALVVAVVSGLLPQFWVVEEENPVSFVGIDISKQYQPYWSSFMDPEFVMGDYLESGDMRGACENHTSHVVNNSVDVDLCADADMHFSTNELSDYDVAFDVVLINDSDTKSKVIRGITLEVDSFSMLYRAYGDYVEPPTLKVSRDAHFDFASFKDVARDYAIACDDPAMMACLSDNQISFERKGEYCHVKTSEKTEFFTSLCGEAGFYTAEWTSVSPKISKYVFDDPYVLTPGEPLRIKAMIENIHALGNRVNVRFSVDVHGEKVRSDLIYLHHY